VRLAIFLAVLLAAAAFAGSAAAVPPQLVSISLQDRHPAASFSAPKAGDATIYMASRPDRATDGSFLSENIASLDILEDSEIQTGHWLYENKLDPGTYYVMIRASADFDQCFNFDTGSYDPACADGYSNVVTMVVPKPTIRFTTSVVAVYKYSHAIALRLRASVLGQVLAYRVCAKTAKGKQLCVTRSLDGFDWDTAADDEATFNTRPLPKVSTFRWIVNGATVASRKVRVR
jgi:hypothetical protein